MERRAPHGPLLLVASALSVYVAAAAAACNVGGPASPSFDAPPASSPAPTTSPKPAPTDAGIPDVSTPPEASADAAPDADDAAATFQTDPPVVSVAKVKNLLVGLPPTDQEIKLVMADPAQLKSLIGGWMAQPEYTQKMMRFFELAFQQTQISITDFSDQAFPQQVVANASMVPLLLQNAQESFARTALELIAEGQPLTQTMTTQRFMMTPALMELYAFLDAWQVDDDQVTTDQFKVAHPKLPITVEAAQGPIPLSQTLDPTSPNYMVWYDPDVANLATLEVAGCAGDPVVYPSSGYALHWLMYGSLFPRTNPSGGTACQTAGTAAAPQMTASDFTTWQMVTIRPPMPNESTTAFYDLPTLRSTAELVLALPRVGFFSTAAFAANWQTNASNMMRVTTNQSLIVATGAMVDGTDPTTPPTTPGLDSAHAAPGTSCFVCHQTLDPTRSIFAATYSWNYHKQDDPTYSQQLGLFAFQGVIAPVTSMVDFGNVLAGHPLFAQAWVQKLCYYANSSACETDDPEFQRVVSVFQSTGYSWNAVVAELLASPLTTNAAATKTTSDNGVVVAVSRRDHLCAAWNGRLGFADVCGLDPMTKSTVGTMIPEIVPGLPSDGYGRGSTAPVLPNQPTLFYRAGTENLCEALAAMVIDVPAAKQIARVTQWSSALPDKAIGDFVSTLMALSPSDARSTQAQTILKAHFTAAQQSGASATDSLKSTFVAACLAPSSVSIGL